MKEISERNPSVQLESNSFLKVNFSWKPIQSEKFGSGVPILNEKIIWLKQKEWIIFDLQLISGRKLYTLRLETPQIRLKS